MKTVSELTEKLQGYDRDLEVLVVDTEGQGKPLPITSLTVDGPNLIIGLFSEVTKTEDADSEDSDSEDGE